MADVFIGIVFFCKFCTHLFLCTYTIEKLGNPYIKKICLTRLIVLNDSEAYHT